MMRTEVAVTLAWLTISGAALAQQSGQQPAQRPNVRQPVQVAVPSVQRRVRPIFCSVATPIDALLWGRVKHIEWDAVPFRDVLHWIAEQSTRLGHVNVVAKWRALALEGIDGDTPITLELRHVFVRDVIDEVLDQVSGVDPVTYYAVNNRLKFTTKSDVRRTRTTRAYDVAEILALARAARVKPQFASGRPVAVAGPNVTVGGTGALTEFIDLGTVLFGSLENDQDDDEDDLDDEAIEQKLIDLIVRTVEPDSWRVNGGAGTLDIFDGTLMVYNSADVHTQLGGRFDLRK